MKWLLPPRLWLFCLIAMALLQFAAPLPRLLPTPVNYLGVLGVLAGSWLVLSGWRQFQRAKTNIKTFNNPDMLVTDGLFAFTRNPMYLGFLLSLLGAALVFNAAINLALVVLFFVVAHAWYIPFEERAAAARFGAAYDAYRKHVRRWI